MFVDEYDTMSDEEKAEHFPDPDVADMFKLWADSGRPTTEVAKASNVIIKLVHNVAMLVKLLYISLSAPAVSV